MTPYTTASSSNSIYNQWWYSCHAGVILYLLDFAGADVAPGKDTPEA